MKLYYVQTNIGHAKYVLNYHNGSKTHSDGSAFYDMEIHAKKKTLQARITQLEKAGYIKQQ